MRRSKQGHFQIWNQASDPYKHTDLSYNFDTLDLMIGSPNQSPLFGVGDDFNNPSTSAPSGTGQWLYPQDGTTIANMGARTLYNIVRALDFNDVPLGGVIAWWRPSIAVPLPSAWAVADGSTYTSDTEHSYGAYGITSVTVPDIRNKMILGAYETATGSSTVGLNRDGTAATSPSVDTATGGPGIGAIGGTNVPRVLTHTHSAGSFAMPDHVHQMNDHVHDAGTHQHTNHHTHTYDLSHSHVTSVTGSTGGPSGVVGSFQAGGSGNTAAGPGHTHSVTASGVTSFVGSFATSDASAATGAGFGTTGTMIPGTQWVGQMVDRFTHLSTSTIVGTSGPASGSALAGVEVQPRYVGLLYIIKIRKAGPLHNTSFPVGT